VQPCLLKLLIPSLERRDNLGLSARESVVYNFFQLPLCLGCINWTVCVFC
jgi:hypothetical protein